jgi:NAD(P)-dependent dehydrogenase (short-subunit alcohol dehydrogenase family)
MGNVTRSPVALVTGSRRGLGRAIALEMATAGYDIIVNDIVADGKVEETLEGVRSRGKRAVFIQSDIARLDTHAEFVNRAYAAYGTIDCLVNNAGIQVKVRGDILDATVSDFDDVMGVNLRGTFFLSQQVARRMVAETRSAGDPRRSIVSISSITARLVQPQLSAYALSKAGVSMMTKLLAARLAAHEIYVLEVRPGVTRSDMSEQIADKYDRIFAETDIVPMKRWGEASDIGKAVAALASGAIPFCTGEGVDVDGGLHLHKFT